MHLSFQIKLALGLLLSFGIFAALIVHMYSNNQEQLETYQRVAHTNEVLSNSEKLLNNLLNAETGQRGYIITNQKEFLAPYLEGIDSVNLSFQRLQRLTSGNPTQQITINRKLGPLIHHWLEILKAIIKAHDNGFDLTRDNRLIKGKKTMDSIRRVIYVMQDVERQLLKKRSLANAEKIALFNHTYIATTAAIAAILAIMFYVIYKNLKARDIVESNLKKAHDEIKDLYNNAPCGYHSLDESGAFTDINDTLLKWLGRSREEVAGKLRFIDILTKNSAESFMSAFQQFKKEGFSINVELELVRKDGTTFSVIENGTAVFDNAGKFTKSRSATFDNTERSFFNNTLDLLVVLSMDGKFQKWNSSWGKVLGYSDDELLGKSVFELIHPEDIERTLLAISEKLSIGEKLISFENRYRSKEGAYHWFLWNAVPAVEKGIMYGFARDITERKQTDEKLKHLNQELEAFTYSVSHDLRAPLRSISGYAQILKEDYVDKLDEEAKRITNIVVTSARRMGQLIDDLLDFSRMGRKELSRANVNMKELVDTIVIELTTQENGRKLNIRVLPLESSHADRSMLRQVWTNLVSNALKYSQKKELTEIEIGSYDEDGVTCYYIKDNGAGFDMRYVDKLFGVFQRLHKMNEFEGTGIGLALVKRIIQRHGGNVWAEGKVGQGAKFYFTIPF